MPQSLNVTDQNFQVRKNVETNHFSDPVAVDFCLYAGTEIGYRGSFLQIISEIGLRDLSSASSPVLELCPGSCKALF